LLIFCYLHVSMYQSDSKLSNIFPFLNQFYAIAIGAHTIGNARCTSFRQRLYNSSNGEPDSSLDQYYAAALRFRCPRSGGDQNLFFLDYATPYKFDNYYFKNILANKGLLSSDQILLTNLESAELVKTYAENNDIFFEQFAKSMIKMGNISPLTNSMGEIRKNCRQINAWRSNIIARYYKIYYNHAYVTASNLCLFCLCSK